LHTYTRGVGTAASVLTTKSWRNAGTATNFEIKGGQAYTYRAGYRLYPTTATAAAPKDIKGGNSVDLTFNLDGATSTLLGFSAIAAATLTTMF